MIESHISEGQKIGDITIVSIKRAGHSTVTFRNIFNITVSYNNKLVSFLEDEYYVYLCTHKNPQELLNYIYFRILLDFFPVKSDFFRFKHAVSSSGINIELEKENHDEKSFCIKGID